VRLPGPARRSDSNFWCVADDEGSGAGGQVECKEKNNWMHVPQIVCPGIID